MNIERSQSKTESKPEEEDDDDDYSASVSALIARRESCRRSSGRRKHRRRHSSPGLDDTSIPTSRRRSSVFTTSSGDTAISIDDANQEQIFHNIRIHKEVLALVKHEPWPMRRKMRLVRQAKGYIKRHEGELQERLAQSKTTRDIVARINILLLNYWQYVKRELANLANNLIPWESRIKQIESHFGSVVSSYFTFLRWLFWVNAVIVIVLVTFVAIPEMIIAKHINTGERKDLLPAEQAKAANLITLWNFEGTLKYSPLFYGYYTNQDGLGNEYFSYKLPLAYFTTGLAVYVYSFVAILRKMAENSRQSKLSEKGDECVFSWKLFTGWDYMIGNSETAHNRTSSIILGFKEALLEEAEKIRDEKKGSWKITSLRVCSHINILWLLGTSVYAVILVVQRSTQPEANSSWWRQNEITCVVSLIGLVYPWIFEMHGFMERYHPRKALRMQLARIMALNLLNLYSFILATFSKIDKMAFQLSMLKPNDSVVFNSTLSPTTITSEQFLTTMSSAVTSSQPTNPSTQSTVVCRQVTVACNTSPTTDLATVTTMSLLFLTGFSTQFDNTIWSTTDNQNTTLDNSTATDFYITSSTNTQELSSYTSTENYSITDSILGSLNETTTEVESSNGIELNFHYYDSKLDSSSETAPQQISTTESENIESSTSSDCYESVCEEVNEASEEYISPTTTEFTANLSTAFPGSHEHDAPRTDLSIHTSRLDIDTRTKLRKLCWETMFGQELVKLTIMDLVVTIITISSVLVMDFFRAVFIRIMNHCWCWDLEKKFPQYGDFKIAENILHLVNNQGMVWMGMFFSPGLPLINVIKLAIIMYVRSWAVLTCNVPHQVVFRASRSNNFYFALLLTMLFLCVLPVGYAVVWLEPSWHCGPFSNYKRIYYIFTRSLKEIIPGTLHWTLDYIASPGIVIPLLMLLVLIIYYLISLTNALREANNDLKIQLRRERTEERRKMFQMVDKRRRGEIDTPLAKWGKILPAIKKIENPTGDKEAQENPDVSNVKTDKAQDVLAKLLRLAARTSSATSEEAMSGGGSDGDQPQLPKDPKERPKDKARRQVKEPDAKKTLKKTEDSSAMANKRSFSDSSSYREREDSIASGWSADHIPEIRISETNSMDNIDVQTGQELHSKSSSTDTVIAVDPKEAAQNSSNSTELPKRSRLTSDDNDESISSGGESYDSIKNSIKEMSTDIQLVAPSSRKLAVNAILQEAKRRRESADSNN